MNCPTRNTETIDLLLDYSAGKLSAMQAAEIEVHLSSCPECRAFAKSQHQIWNALDTWEAAPVSESFDRRLFDRIAEVERQPSWRDWFIGRRMWRPALSIGAACAALAVVLTIPAVRDTGARNPATPATVIPIENTRSVDPIEPEQLERALDDLEMLKQLSSSSVQNL